MEQGNHVAVKDGDTVASVQKILLPRSKKYERHYHSKRNQDTDRKF